MASNFYYVMELAAFIAVLVFQGRISKNKAAEATAAQAVASQTIVISAQAERIALLEKQNSDQATKLKTYETRIAYLEEVLNIHGPAQVVQARPVAGQ